MVVSIKFSSVAKDDYRVKSANVILSKPSEYKHFLDKYLLYELKVPNRKPIGELRVFFMKIYQVICGQGIIQR